MALVLDDRVKETSTTTGTGTLNLSGAVSGFQTFVAGIGDGNTTYYAIVNRDEAEWETGLGTVTDASTDTLARTTVFTTNTVLGQVVIEWQASTEINRQGYNIYRSVAGAPFVLAGTINNTSSGIISYTDNSLNTETQTNGYYISVIDSCGNESAYTSAHTVSNISTTAGFSEINIQWTPYVGFTNFEYEVQRRQPGIDWATLATLPKDSVNYTDVGTTCKIPYNYRIKTNNLDIAGLFSLSDTTLTIANDTVPPSPPYMVRVTRELSAPNVVFVQWALSPETDVKEYILQRSRRYTAGWKTIYSTTANDTFFYDTLSNISSQSYCYRLYAIDLCNNVSQVGNMGCLLILRATAEPFVNKLVWEGYSNWPQGILEYRIYRSENGQFFMPIGDVNGNSFAYEDSLLTDTASLFCYYIEAQENIGKYSAISTSNTVCVTQKAAYYIPNSFTPRHSTGLNDGFGPVGVFIARVKINIYDRWGKEIYTSKNGERFWNGTDNSGRVLPEGIYMYNILVYSHDGTKTIDRGNVTILR